jgi:hypothetical protein
MLDGRGKRGVGAVLVLLMGLVVACGPKRPAKAPLLPPAVAVYVAITDQVAKTDTGNIAAMVDVIEADLRDAGRSVTIVAARQDERPPVPRLELQVMGSDSGNATMRGAGNLGGFFGAGVGLAGTAVAFAGRGTISVDAYVVPNGVGPAVYLGRIESSSFGAMSDEAIVAGERAGHAIAWRALHDPPPPPPTTDAAAKQPALPW